MATAEAVTEERADVLSVRQARGLSGRCEVPGSSEVSMMALALGAKAEGETLVRRCATGRTVKAFAEVLQGLGASISFDGEDARVRGPLRAPDRPLVVPDSDAAFACLAGLAAGSSYGASLVGDPSLADWAPPAAWMAVVEALEAYGAILRRGDASLLPIEVGRVGVKRGEHRIGAPRSDVKAAVFLAAAGNGGPFALFQDLAGDDDIEVLFRASGCPIDKSRVEGADGYRLSLGTAAPRGAEHALPGDASAAAYVLTAAALLGKTDLDVANVGNDFRTRRFLDLLRRMNAVLQVDKTRTESGFSTRTIHVKGGELRRFKVADEYAAMFRDEVPLLAVAGACATGETVIRDAGELRKGGQDVIALTAEGLRRLDVRVGEMPDGLVVEGTNRLQAAELDAGGDPRVALAFAIAGLAAEGETRVVNPGPVGEIYPGVLDRIVSVAQFRRK